MTGRALALIGLAFGLWPSSAAAKPPLEKAPPGIGIAPISIAKVVRIGGEIVLAGDWISYEGRAPSANLIDAPAFDCYGREPGTAPTGTIGTNCPASCPLPNGQTVDGGIRWYFGAGYHNPNTVEDLQDCACPPGAVMSEIDLAFFWAPPSASPCYVIFLPFEEVLGYDGHTGLCTDPSTMTDTGGGGIAMYLGVLPPSTTSIFYARVSGLEGLGARFPSTNDNGDPAGYPDGSYQMVILESLFPTVLARGPCQPMLWGTSTNGTGPADCRPGHNNHESYDDDSPADGSFSPAECYDYVFECPDPLGKCNAFCYLRCPADYNNDGFVDGIDSDQFNNAFEAGDACADLNGDCVVDRLDCDYFCNQFESACQ
jgi:hypothetical protein